MAFPPNKSTDNLVALQNVLYIGEESKTSDLQDLNEVFAKDKKLPFVRKMYLAAFTSLLMALAMGLATGYSSPATYDMTTRPGSPVQPSKDAVSWIGSTLALGAMLGGVCAGPLTDKMGRKDTLVFNIIPFAIGWLAISFSKGIVLIIFGRFVCGFSCGIVSVTVPMYCVEISTPDVRGLLGSAFQGFLVIGNLISVIVGSYTTWEHLALFGAAIATMGLICFCRMPETPRWLLAKGKLDQAILVMQYLQGGHTDAEEECTAIYKDLEFQRKGLLSWKEFKHPTVYKPTVICLLLMFFQQFSGANAVFFYSSIIFKVSKDFMKPENSTIVLATVQVVATLGSNFIVDKAGRKLLLLLSSIFMTLSLIALGIYYYFALNNEDFGAKFSWMPLISLISFVIAFSIGYGSVPWLLIAEMVPVRARSTVGGLGTFVNGLFAFIVTKTFTQLEDLIQTHGTFWTYSSVTALSFLVIFFILPETKG
ncbi:Facilitated trehalose transporter Tret1, partial [Stegodyphus mimosarum]